MRTKKAHPWLVFAACSVLAVLVFPLDRVSNDVQQVPAALSIINLPSLQTLLSKAGISENWIPSILAIAIGSGLLLYFAILLRRALKRIDGNLTGLREQLLAIDTGQPEFGKLKSELAEQVEKHLKKLETGMQSLADHTNDKINSLEEMLKEWKPKTADPDESSTVELPDEAIIDEVVAAPEVIMPPGQISIEEMLAWAGKIGLVLKTVKATLGLFGNFSPSDAGDNWLAENSNRNQSSFLFPRSERFETADHYDMYREYYNCVQPASGKIVIESPALVEIDSEQGGWKLRTKGELSVVP